jgi:mRNA interferase MazF
VQIARGDVVVVSLPTGSQATDRESTSQRARPFVVVQNDDGNRASPLTIVVPLRTGKPEFPLNVPITKRLDLRLDSDSIADCAQIYTIHQTRIQKRLGRVSPHEMRAIDSTLLRSLDLTRWRPD